MVNKVAGWWRRLREALRGGRRGSSPTRSTRGGSPGASKGVCRRAGEGDVVQAFIDGLLRHDSPDVRAGAARKLGEFGPRAGKRAIEALARALNDDDPGVRSSAALSLADFGEEVIGCVDALIEALGDADDDVRSSAGVALQDIGTAAVPALERALAHDNPLVRFEAQMLLKRGQASGEGPVGPLGRVSAEPSGQALVELSGEVSVAPPGETSFRSSGETSVKPLEESSDEASGEQRSETQD